MYPINRNPTWMTLCELASGRKIHTDHLVIVLTTNDNDTKHLTIALIRNTLHTLACKITKIRCYGSFENADEIEIETDVPMSLFKEMEAEYHEYWNELLEEEPISEDENEIQEDENPSF